MTQPLAMMEDFRWRGMLSQASEGLADLAVKERLTGYIGFDPTAASLHVGSLLPIMALARFQRHGHTPIAIVGGGTGLVGDPSGKSQERPLLTPAQIEENLAGLRKQLEPFLDFSAQTNPARIVNNADWLTTIPLMEFLRDVGKYFTVNYMLNKESVKRRIDSEDGISFTEFSYMLTQAYDFLVLYDRYGCKLQMGGSDQWGNITAGMDLIGKLRRIQAHGLVFPLVTTSAGKKFGKTEAGTVWLDPSLTSPYHFYQFWYNTDDRDVVRYLKFFTWLSEQEITELEQKTMASPERREGQIRLAEEVCRMVHGVGALEGAKKAASALFGGDIRSLTETELLDALSDAPFELMSRDRFIPGPVPVVDLCVHCSLVSSKGEAKRLIQSKGLYLNNRRVLDEKEAVTLSDALHGRFFVLRRGQKEVRSIRLVN